MIPIVDKIITIPVPIITLVNGDTMGRFTMLNKVKYPKNTKYFRFISREVFLFTNMQENISLIDCLRANISLIDCL